MVGTRKEYRSLVDPTCARVSKLRDAPASKTRKDAIEIDQLPAWFAGVAKLRNRTAAVYLQALMLTGARREEMATLGWGNVDFRWKKLTIADKVDATRTIPLTPYVAWLLSNLPRRNAYVFAVEKSKSGRLSEPRSPHAEVLADAGIPHVSIHGCGGRSRCWARPRARQPALSRKSWDIARALWPKATAHAPSMRCARIRPDRDVHPKRAGVDFDPAVVPGALRVVNA